MVSNYRYLSCLAEGKGMYARDLYVLQSHRKMTIGSFTQWQILLQSNGFLTKRRWCVKWVEQPINDPKCEGLNPALAGR
jgi:hypothetical protein